MESRFPASVPLTFGAGKLFVVGTCCALWGVSQQPCPHPQVLVAFPSPHPVTTPTVFKHLHVSLRGIPIQAAVYPGLCHDLQSDWVLW